MKTDNDALKDKDERFELYKADTSDSITSLVGSFNQDGDLVIEGYDAGELVEKFWGDFDYEYWITIKSERKDLLLLKLLKENVARSHALKSWLDENGVPYEFSSWI